MVIKTRKKNRPGRFNYRGGKQVLTPADIQLAEKQEQELEKLLLRAENFLLDGNFLSKDRIKKNPLKVWYIIGDTLNQYLKRYPIEKGEEKIFWRDLYERETLLHKNMHKKIITETKNDYKMASYLSARYSYEELKKIGPWALVREIFLCKNIINDPRLINLVIKSLSKVRNNRDISRPFIKNVSKRFKFLETSVLTDEELKKKFDEIESPF